MARRVRLRPGRRRRGPPAGILAALSAGEAAGIDLITGFTADEYRLFTTLLGTAEHMHDERSPPPRTRRRLPGPDHDRIMAPGSDTPRGRQDRRSVSRRFAVR
ncbi:hypothetical protein GCM10010357_41320 [Streptomyces luteireticuli]|uniref:MarR family transcriptional regulator n=1 Tax=Streptomyces luteireticuli TaxID=173858 RepID=A0ABN0YX11_9ACTN